MGHLELNSERYLDRPITHPEKITPALVTLAFEFEAKKIFPHELPPLPYATDALEEVIVCHDRGDGGEESGGGGDERLRDARRHGAQGRRAG